MADELLSRLDDRLAALDAGRGRRQASIRRAAVQPEEVPDLPVAETSSTKKQRLPWVEIFIAVQFLWGALLFLPGAQPYRPLIRGLPYAVSVGLLLVYLPRAMRGRAPRGTLLLAFALGLLFMNLLHPTTQVAAGIAQCLFQAAIAAPMFWAWRAVRSPAQLRRLLVLAFVFNAAGSALGVLQVYYPDQFMPPQFSSLGTRMNDLYVESLTYVGIDGRRIIRPPGLSDQPGGAAVAGALTVVLGVGLSVAARTPGVALAQLAAVAVGLAAIYLTQVRSLLMMSVGALAVIAILLFRRGQARLAGRIAVSAGVLVVLAFFWARSVGGESVEQRFVGITQQGAVRSYQENRGAFVADTFGDLLDKYPFGAGLGRWGMMNVYFGDPANLDAAPIHVEIQVTGWLLDGGILMWMFYGGAVAMALVGVYRFCLKRVRLDLAEVAIIVVGAQALVAGSAWAGPVFNTQLGSIFWFLTSALYGASRGVYGSTSWRK
ncbi:MAG: hypothetical protein JJE40_12700 [Vicinamibacteria bacterium]|nr:hypothetical protein [Vicinamibacteria bacterium]